MSSSSAASAASAVSVMNINILLKEAMANMPDTLNTKKEIDEYYKKEMKEISDKMKEEKKAVKGKAPRKALGTKPVKAAPKKRVKKVEVDEDGNEIVKVKKPLNNYQKFIQEQRPKVKEDYPELNGEEIFTKIAELWKKHKEDIKNVEDVKSDTTDDAADDVDTTVAATTAAAAAAAAAATTAAADTDNEITEEKKDQKPKKEKKAKKEAL